MSLIDLFTGVAVVIDDEVNDGTANITLILNQLVERSIPIVKFDSLPEDSYISHLSGLSFLLLDWRLVNIEVEEGNVLPDGIANFSYEQNIEFIKKVESLCFCPIFIFTNENTNSVCSQLEEAGLYDRSRPSRILVKNKAELTDANKLAEEIESWVNGNPSIYVLKEWEREYQKSKDTLFSDFQSFSPRWPKVMWDNFGADRANRSLELGELISRNLHNRMSPFEFNGEIMDSTAGDVAPDELRLVLQGEKYLTNDKLHEDHLAPGDVFKKSGKYYLNIRAGCDLIPDRTLEDSIVDDVEMYFLVGRRLSSTKEQEFFRDDYGLFSELDSQSIVFPIDNKLAVDFRFKRLEIHKWGDWKEKRIGRLLPPYVNRIQQKYGLFIQRQALPRIPQDAIRRD